MSIFNSYCSADGMNRSGWKDGRKGTFYALQSAFLNMDVAAANTDHGRVNVYNPSSTTSNLRVFEREREREMIISLIRRTVRFCECGRISHNLSSKSRCVPRRLIPE